MTTRLKQLKQYLAEADPIEDKLYIEDLKVSIAYEKKYKGIRSGFKMENEE